MMLFMTNVIDNEV